MANREEKRRDSNIRLKAAALELLLALRESRRLLADALQAFGPCDHGVGICNCDMQRSLEASDAAIAKATGRTA